MTPKISEVSKECLRQHSDDPDARIVLSVHVVCHPGESAQFYVAEILKGSLPVDSQDLESLQESLEEAYFLEDDHTEEFVHIATVEESGEFASFPAWDRYFVVTSFEDIGFGVEVPTRLDAANAEIARLRSSPAPVVGGVPDLTIDHEMVWAINYYKEGDFDSTVFRAGWYALASRLPALKPGEVEELAILREIVRMLDEARERNRRRPRGAGAPPMGDEIDDLLHRLCEIGAHPAMRAQPTPTEKEPT